jgi:hypothetical protein
VFALHSQEPRPVTSWIDLQRVLESQEMEQTLPGFQLGSSWVLAIGYNGLPTDVIKWSDSYCGEH